MSGDPLAALYRRRRLVQVSYLYLDASAPNQLKQGGPAVFVASNEHEATGIVWQLLCERGQILVDREITWGDAANSLNEVTSN